MGSRNSEPAREDDHHSDGDGDELIVDVTLDATTAVMTISGELDMSNTDRVRTCVAEAIERGASRIVFELGALDFIDSSGITVLIEAANQTGSVAVRNPSVAARRIIEATGLSGVLRIES